MLREDLVKDALTEAGMVVGVAAWSLIAALLAVTVALLTVWVLIRLRQTRRYRGAPASLEEMPGHPERIQFLADPVEDEIFGDVTERLLDEGIADLCERTGWFQ
ncbi:hypothetical protein ACRYCC_26055 [Actinomadura scrupuli]|uniref:hypothetical protein n=1 Tax=Actinomadura scrupuli TaxID=559629 RepID=UPI003D97F6EF